MTTVSKLDAKFWQTAAYRYPSDPADAPHPDPFAMSPEEEAAWEATVAKREAEQKAKDDAAAAERRWWNRSEKIMLGLLCLQIFLATVQLVAISLR